MATPLVMFRRGKEMSLFYMNQLLSEAVDTVSRDVLTEVAIGQTTETANLRIHRYSSAIRVTDLTNAGKRGKKVDEFALYDIDSLRDPRMKDLVEMFAAMLSRGRIKTYKQALTAARGLVDESERIAKASDQFLSVPKIETGQYKGVRVAPAGFKPIDFKNPNIALYADNERFRITDMRDKYNEPTLIAPLRGKVASVKKFYEWARNNMGKLNRMTFRDVMKEMKRAGIDYHYYCAVD